MDSKLHSGNGTEFPATTAVETERTVGAEAAPEKEAEPVADHPTVTTELAPASETTIPEKVHYSPMASNLHSANGIPKTETESEIPSTAVEVAPEKKVKPLADRQTVTLVDCVFRVIVPMLKVESIIGRNGNGDLINKICQETKAHMRVLEDPVWHPDRVVQISGKEDIEAPLSPAMDAVIRVFKRVNGFPENESNGVASIPFCSIRLLVSSMQATGLIGKQGSSVHTVQENIGCSVRILSSDEVSTLSANSDDRVVDLHGAGLKVLQALEAVLGHLRALPLTEKTAKTVPNGAFSEPVKRPTFHPSDKTTPSSPLFGFGFASSSSSTPFSVSSPTFGFGASAFSGSSLFGSSSSSSGTSLFGSTFTFGTSTIFGASSTSAVTSPFSSGLYGSSSPTPSFTTPTTTNTANKTFGTGTISGASSTSAVTSPFSSGLYGSSSSPTPSFTTPTTTNTGHFKKRKKTTTNTFGTSTIFGASSTSAVTSPFSSGLYGSSSSPTPDFTTPTTTNTASKTFGTSNIFGASSTSAVTSPFSSGFFGSSSPAPSFMTPTTTNTASKPFGTSTIYGASSTSAVTKPFSSGLSGATTGYVPSFASATTTTTTTTSGTSSSFLGFQTSPKTVAATTPSLQPQSTPASSLLGAQNIKDSIRNKAYWNVDIIKTFLDACIHEITINGWDGGNLTLKAMSWKKVGEKLKKRHKFSVDIEQMEDYFDGLKSKYIAWLSLRNECIKTLKNPPLPFPDLCAQLFYGALAAGFFLNGSDRAFTGPAHRKKRHREVSGGPSGEASLQPQAPPVLPTAPPLPTTQTLVELQKEPMVEVPPELPQVQPATAFIGIETEAEVPPELPQVQPATIIKTKRSRPVFEEEILGVLKMIAGKMNKPEPPPKPTFEDCEKKLNELGWPKDDPLHLVALTIFCDEKNNYRELWMNLNKNLCANWVRMIGRGERFL